MLETRIYAALCFSFFFLIGEVSGTTYPLAQDVKWSSIDFKTLLMWGPEPTNYSYTVEFSVVGKDRERNPHCIRTMSTECDLTSMLTKLNETYTAVVSSEPLPRETSDLSEFPFTRSEKFCPYEDTNIGKPEFKIEVSKDKRKITLYIKDPLSALYKDGRFLNMRDIFMGDLKYRVSYGKAQTSGKRTQDTDSNEIELDVDKGASYCFNVQAYIPSRLRRQLGESSQSQCSPAEDRPFYEEYGIGVIAGVILVVITALISAIVIPVVLCKRRHNTRNNGKDDCL